ncbi:S-adenosyl-L-methionine-dependent methyltransferase [Lasiosphaeria ovina]|uniref:S-adenosyl-L-methionine-dependent methyltransferase n=1 Tax=Lasiosphaeria ovina TaxID=92902 RepID=A0AAE0NAW9_9PEZI|nr:S-adenosyl-L-methionine-dependent methyltransferase [Lasiosphaeria ovina]
MTTSNPASKPTNAAPNSATAAAPIIDDHALLASNYASVESRFGWDFLLGGNRHFGYYASDTWWPLPFAAAQRRMEEQLFNTLSAQPGARVLDAGCGDGHVALFMAARGGLRVTAFDVLERHVANARRNVARAVAAQKLGDEHDGGSGGKGTVTVEHLDFAHLGTLPAASFAAVYTSEALLHATDPAAVMGEFWRVLEPGGRLVMHEFHHDFADQAVSPGYTREINKTVVEVPRIVAAGQAKTKRGQDGVVLAFDRLEAYFTKILDAAGYENVEIRNYSDNIQPMLRFLSVFGMTRHVVRLLRLQKLFPNAAASTEGYVGQEHWAYASISAMKPDPKNRRR